MKKKQWNMLKMSKDEFDIIVRVMGLFEKRKDFYNDTQLLGSENIIIRKKQKRNEMKTLFEKYLRSGYEDFCDFKTYKYYVRIHRRKMKIKRNGERK